MKRFAHKSAAGDKSGTSSGSGVGGGSGASPPALDPSSWRPDVLVVHPLENPEVIVADNPSDGHIRGEVSIELRSPIVSPSISGGGWLSPGVRRVLGGSAKVLPEFGGEKMHPMFSPTKEVRDAWGEDETHPLSPPEKKRGGGGECGEEEEEDECDACMAAFGLACFACTKAVVIYINNWCETYLAKGEWIDVEENDTFVDRYEPLFGNYISYGASYFFVAFELFRKFTEALILSSFNGQPGFQLLILIFMRLFTVCHLIAIRPFIDRVENLVQVCVMFQETMFLAALWGFHGAEGAEGWLGSFLNYLNMGGMGILIANSMGRQILGCGAEAFKFLSTIDWLQYLEFCSLTRFVDGIEDIVEDIADVGVEQLEALDVVEDGLEQAASEVGTGANQVWRSAAHNVVLAGSVVAAFGAGAASAGIANEMMAGATQDVGTDFAGERLENNNDKGDGSDENNKERLPNQPLRPTGLRNVAS